MPNVEVYIGGRMFEVSCQDGEEHYLQAAAKMLDEEASMLSSEVGRVPEAKMLLMAGLMLADKVAGAQDRLREAQDQMAEKEAELDQMRQATQPAPQRIEVPVVPDAVTDVMAEIAARVEAIADQANA